MSKNNLLLGNGQALVGATNWPTPPAEKASVYSIDESRQRLHPQLQQFLEQGKAVPKGAAPRGEMVGRVVVHPEYIAKSYFPTSVLRDAGLRHVGTRGISIHPERRNRKKREDEPMYTAEMLVAGTLDDFAQFDKLLMQSRAVGVQNAMTRIEQIQLMQPVDRLRRIKAMPDGTVLLEAVLHASAEDSDIITEFEKWARSCDGDADMGRRVVLDSVTFIPVRIAMSGVENLAKFTHVRVLRSMAPMRSHDGALRGLSVLNPIWMPGGGAIAPDIRAAVFDGGMDAPAISAWAPEHTWSETTVTTDGYLDHGAAVTSALLFGPVMAPNVPLPTPFASVDHFRVATSHDATDPEMFDALRRICEVIDRGQHEYINISLAPRDIVYDDDVHLWTSVLEKRLCDGRILATVAVGNDGAKPFPASRVQVPADLVNALAVGSCTGRDGEVKRAAHSSIGPGRSPGLIKPDGLAWGENVPLFDPRSQGLVLANGSSMAAPLALRTCLGAAAMADGISPRVARALLLHNTDRSAQADKSEVGFGRFASDPLDIISCNDHEAMVVYEGVLQPSTPVGAMLPWPTGSVAGKVHIRATLIFYTEVDVAHPMNYTRAGIETRLRRTPGGKTVTFFSKAGLYSGTEQEMRTDAHKWETVLSREIGAYADTLQDPTLELIFRAREEGGSVPKEKVKPLPYVLVVTVSAPSEPQYYNRVRQRHPVLTPLRLRAGISLPNKT